MSAVTTSTSKGEKSKKFQSLDINNIYQGSATKPQRKAIPQKHGLQSLGKVPTARRAPANLPSLKAENSGNDPTVNIVPAGSSGWGKDDGNTNISANSNSANSSSASNSNQAVLAGGNSLTQKQNGPKPSTASQHNLEHYPPSSTNSLSSLDLTSSSQPTSWKNVAQPPQRQKFLGQRSNPLFRQEFPCLSSAANSTSEDYSNSPPVSVPVSTGSIAQKLKEGSSGNANDLKYGPGPNLRPQTFGNWSQGGCSKPQNGNVNDQSGNIAHGTEQQNQGSAASNAGLAGVNRQQPNVFNSQRDLVSSASSAFKFDVSTKPQGGNNLVNPTSVLTSLLRKSASTTTTDLSKRGRRVDSKSKTGTGPINHSGSGLFQQAIIDDEKLKRMDELGNEESDWFKSDETFDYNKKIASDDEDYNSNWTEHIQASGGNKLNPSDDSSSHDNQAPRRIVPPSSSSDFRDEDDQRRAKKNEEVLKTIERAKRRREEEEEKYKNQSSSQNAVYPHSRNDHEYFGGHARYHDRKSDRNNRRSPASNYRRDNHVEDSRQQQGSHHGMPFGKFDVGSSQVPESASDEGIGHQEDFKVASRQHTVGKDDRAVPPQQSYDGGRYGVRKSPSSVPPRFKRNAVELHPIKRVSPPKAGSPDLSDSSDFSRGRKPKEEFASFGRSSTRKSPGNCWDGQSSGDVSDHQDHHPPVEKCGGSGEVPPKIKEEDEPASPSVLDPVSGSYSKVYPGSGGGTNRRGNRKDFFTTDESADTAHVDGWISDTDAQSNHLKMSVDLSGLSKYHDDREKQGRRKCNDGSYHSDGRNLIADKDRRGRRGDNHVKGDSRYERQLGGRSDRGGDRQPLQRKLILPKSSHRGASTNEPFPNRLHQAGQDKTLGDGKGDQDEVSDPAMMTNPTESMRNLSVGSCDVTPPPLEQLAPKLSVVSEQNLPNQSNQLKFDNVPHSQDFDRDQATQQSEIVTRPNRDLNEGQAGGWFAPRGQPSRRGRGGLGMNATRQVPPQKEVGMFVGEDHHRMRKDDEWDASSDRSYEDRKQDVGGDNYYGRRNQRYQEAGGYGRRGDARLDRNYDLKDGKRGIGVGGNLIDRPTAVGIPKPMGIGYDNRRQSKLPPRLAKQKEQSKIASGSNQGGWDTSPVDVSAAWGDQTQNILSSQRHERLGEFGSFREEEAADSSAAVGAGGDGIAVSCSVPVSESETAPVQTIIFENKNFKGGGGVGCVQGTPSVVSSGLDSIGHDKPSFKVVQASGDLMKQDGLQMPIGFASDKGDESGLRLDFAFVDPDSLIHHGEQKNISLGCPRPQTVVASSSHHPTEDLNMKIASVKKVWEQMPSMLPVPDSSAAFTQGFTSVANTGSGDAKAFATSGDSQPSAVTASGAGTRASAMDPSCVSTTSSVATSAGGTGGFGSNDRNLDNSVNSNVAKVRPQLQQQSQLNHPKLQTGIPQQHGNVQAQQRGYGLQDDRAASFRAAAAAMMNAGQTGATGTGSYNRLANIGSGSALSALHSPQSVLNQPPNLYQTFQLEQGRGMTTSQLYPAYAGLGGQASVLLPSSGLSPAGSTSGTDLFGHNSVTQFRLQGTNTSAQFAHGQQQSSGNNMLLSQTGLMSPALKQSNQIGPIGSKAGSGPFQQSGLGILPGSGTSPMHLIPYDGQGQINYAMHRSAAGQAASGQTAFYQALTASTQQAAAASRQQTSFPNVTAHGFTAHQFNAAAMRSAVAGAPSPPVGISSAAVAQAAHSLKTGPPPGADTMCNLQHQLATAHQKVSSTVMAATYTTSQQAVGNVRGNSNNNLGSGAPTYSPTPIQRPMGHQANALGSEDDGAGELKEKKKLTGDNN